MMDNLATHKSFCGKIAATKGVICVTLIKVPFKNDNCNKYRSIVQLIRALLKMFLILLN